MSSVFDNMTTKFDTNPDLRRQATDQKRLSRDLNLARREAIKRNDRKGALEISLLAADKGIKFGGISQHGDLESGLKRINSQNKFLRNQKISEMRDAEEARRGNARLLDQTLEFNEIALDGLRGGETEDEDDDKPNIKTPESGPLDFVTSGINSLLDKYKKGIKSLGDPEKENKFKKIKLNVSDKDMVRQKGIGERSDFGSDTVFK